MVQSDSILTIQIVFEKKRPVRGPANEVHGEG